MFGSKPVHRPDHSRPKGVRSVRRDKKIFTHTADSTHSLNTLSGLGGRPMRGGIRL